MIIERILQILEFKGITKYKFCKDLGVSNAFLDKSREITTDKYANILEYFTDINPNWLLTGKGDMLKTGEKPVNQFNTIETQYNNILMSEFLTRIEKQSEEIGRLKAENNYLREQLTEKTHKLK
jgi:tRNA A37 threonylcarbamoyladenosine modification protein TsaB